MGHIDGNHKPIISSSNDINPAASAAAQPPLASADRKTRLVSLAKLAARPFNALGKSIKDHIVKNLILTAYTMTSRQKLADQEMFREAIRPLTGLSFSPLRAAQADIRVATAKGDIKLDAVAISHREGEEGTPTAAADQKWVLFLFQKDGYYQQDGAMLTGIALASGANVLAVNYRGVMFSEGKARSSEDLVQDGMAAMRHLLEQGVPPQNIVVHGWSMGGGVATEVAARQAEAGQPVHLCADRSFSSMRRATKGVVNDRLKPLGSTAGWLVDKLQFAFHTQTRLDELAGRGQNQTLLINSQSDEMIKGRAQLRRPAAADDGRVRELQLNPALASPHNYSLSKLSARQQRLAEETAQADPFDEYIGWLQTTLALPPTA